MTALLEILGVWVLLNAAAFLVLLSRPDRRRRHDMRALAPVRIISRRTQ